MKINSVDGALNFKGNLNNKAVLKGLEKISEHSASFVALTSFISAVTLRPLAISVSPKVKKENKEYSFANSISSGLMKLIAAEAVAFPLENAIKKIDKNPEKFLRKETINNLKSGADGLLKSEDYKFLTQGIKLGANLITAIPKSMLTLALIPVIMDKIFDKKQKMPKLKQEKYNPVFNPVVNSPSFQGNGTKLSNVVSKIINNKKIQNFTKKHSKNSANIARNISNLTDMLLTSTFVLQTKKSDKIKKENKNPLIYNNVISTVISILTGSLIDKLIQKNTKGYIEKFTQANKNDPKLLKYIEGINVLRPTIIFAFIYYGILPVLTNTLAQKFDNIASEKKF